MSSFSEYTRFTTGKNRLTGFKNTDFTNIKIYGLQLSLLFHIGVEFWSLTLREGHRLSLHEDRVPGKMDCSGSG